jgi:hypothetical protein
MELADIFVMSFKGLPCFTFSERYDLCCHLVLLRLLVANDTRRANLPSEAWRIMVSPPVRFG